MYLIAILIPPLAVLLCGKPFQAVVNLALCCLLIVPGIVHALLVVGSYKADERAIMQHAAAAGGWTIAPGGKLQRKCRDKGSAGANGA